MGRWKDKYVIGLTGNIAVGKSLVRQMLQHLGAYTIDADSLTHQAMTPGAPAYLPIVEMFGKFILDENGSINRNLLGSIVFTYPNALVKLEAIVHPIVNQAIMALASRAKPPVIVIEAIKLLESPNLASAVDAVWVVDASAEAQVKRLTEKRKMSEEEARKRIFAQRPQADKIKRANVVIMNDGNPEDTWKQVQAAWMEVVQSLKLSAAEDGSVRATQPLQPVSPQSIPAKPVTSTLQPPQTGTLQPPKPAAAPAASAAAPAAPAQPVTPLAASPASAAPPKPVTGTLRPLVAADAPRPAASATPAAPAPAAPAPQATAPAIDMLVRRGRPGETEQIASFINRVGGKNVTRMDVMLAFGQKSYLVAEDKSKSAIIGIVGWQVENLITRVDEIYIDPAVAKDPTIAAMVAALEDHSKDLQSEVSFVFLPNNTPQDVIQGLLKNGYQPLRLEEIKFPAWREAAHELITPESKPLMKPLRQDRVMKPI